MNIYPSILRTEILILSLTVVLCSPCIRAEEHEHATHSAALYEGKYATGGHAAIHRDDVESAHALSIGLAALWESKYVTEGRNNLDDGGIFSLEAVLEWKNFFGGVWFAAGDDETYQEVNLFIEYGFDVGPLDLSVGYTHLEFLEDHENDDEFAAGMALNSIPYLIPAIDYVYSTEAEGGFIEISVRSEIPLFEERLVFEPYVMQAFDLGYATEDHDGVNNFQIGIGASFALTERLDLVGSLSHSWAQSDVDREDLGDLSWGTVGVAAAF
jgi:hypothetical protein